LGGERDKKSQWEKYMNLAGGKERGLGGRKKTGRRGKEVREKGGGNLPGKIRKKKTPQPILAWEEIGGGTKGRWAHDARASRKKPIGEIQFLKRKEVEGGRASKMKIAAIEAVGGREVFLAAKGGSSAKGKVRLSSCVRGAKFKPAWKRFGKKNLKGWEARNRPHTWVSEGISHFHSTR